MKLFQILLLVSTMIFSACNGGTKTSEKTPQTTNKPATAAPQSTIDPADQLPSITNEIMDDLWTNCDAVDFLFYDLPISMNQEDQASIRQTLKHVSTTPARINKGCKPIGRIFFNGQGESLMEAEIVFNKQCQYYIFYENKKKTYANQMAKEGVDFMNKILAVKTVPSESGK